MPVADVIRQAIETVCKDDGFLIPSPEAADALECANALLKWILDNQESEIYLKFCNDIVKMLKELLFQSSSNLSKKERAKLWERLFQLQSSPPFAKL